MPYTQTCEILVQLMEQMVVRLTKNTRGNLLVAHQCGASTSIVSMLPGGTYGFTFKNRQRTDLPH